MSITRPSLRSMTARAGSALASMAPPAGGLSSRRSENGERLEVRARSPDEDQNAATALEGPHLSLAQPSSWKLPVEIHAEIVSHCGRSALAQLCLVSAWMLDLASRELYRTVELSDAAQLRSLLCARTQTGAGRIDHALGLDQVRSFHFHLACPKVQGVAHADRFLSTLSDRPLGRDLSLALLDHPNKNLYHLDLHFDIINPTRMSFIIKNGQRHYRYFLFTRPITTPLHAGSLSNLKELRLNFIPVVARDHGRSTFFLVGTAARPEVIHLSLAELCAPGRSMNWSDDFAMVDLREALHSRGVLDFCVSVGARLVLHPAGGEEPSADLQLYMTGLEDGHKEVVSVGDRPPSPLSLGGSEGEGDPFGLWT